MNIDSYVELKPNPKIPAFRPGDTVRVHAKVIEGDRERIQAFEGVVIRIRRGGPNSNFTVRRISHGIGVERIFPYFSPLIDKVDVIRVGRVRRAKLYYLRDRVGKAARIKAGSRARFEELTAAMGATPLAKEIEEEEVLESEEELEEGAAEGDESTEESEETVEVEVGEVVVATEEPEAEVAAEEPDPEASAESEPEAEAAAEPEPEVAADPEAAAEPSAEEPTGDAASEPAAEDDAKP